MIDYLTKIIYYKPIMINIDIISLVKIVIDRLMRQNSLSGLIISNKSSDLYYAIFLT